MAKELFLDIGPELDNFLYENDLTLDNVSVTLLGDDQLCITVLEE